MIQPVPQIAVAHEIETQERHQIREGPAQATFELQVAQQQHRNERGPHLNLERIGRSADKGFDLQVLLEGLEEQLDLPALLVNGSDGGGAKLEMIGQKDQGLVCLGVPFVGPTLRCGATSEGISWQSGFHSGE